MSAGPDRTRRLTEFGVLRDSVQDCGPAGIWDAGAGRTVEPPVWHEECRFEPTMRELRIHGRGGQGAVVASKILAAAFFREGRFVQSFPAFGVERRGAPVTAFLRLSDQPIRLRCEVTEPDDLVVLDSTLVEAVDVTAGLKPGGSILINSDRWPEDYPRLLGRFRVATVDAAAIARRHGLGSKTQPIVNTAILGAFATFSGLVSLASVRGAIEEEAPIQARENVAAAEEAASSIHDSAGPRPGARAPGGAWVAHAEARGD